MSGALIPTTSLTRFSFLVNPFLFPLSLSYFISPPLSFHLTLSLPLFHSLLLYLSFPLSSFFIYISGCISKNSGRVRHTEISTAKRFPKSAAVFPIDSDDLPQPRQWAVLTRPNNRSDCFPFSGAIAQIGLVWLSRSLSTSHSMNGRLES